MKRKRKTDSGSELSVVVESVDDQHVDHLEREDNLAEGTYWTYVGPSDEDYKTGDVFLLLKIEYVDSVADEMELLWPPERQKGSGGWTSHYKHNDFYNKFIFCPDGKEQRRLAVESLQQELLEYQEKLLDVSTNPEAAMKALQESKDEKVQEELKKVKPALGLPAPDAGTSLSLHDSKTEKDQLLNQVAVIEASSALITSMNEDIQGTLAKIGTYTKEAAMQAKAKVATALELAKKADKMVNAIDLFMGEGVDVENICSGASADQSVRFHVFQNLLYMDEESLIDAAFGGADVDNFDEFFSRLAEDSSLKQRILPTERCIVAMKPRRYMKTYSDGFITARMAALNSETFLLIRNGENINAVFSPLVHQEHLFPTQIHMDSAYKKRDAFLGLDARNITTEDLGYAKARNKYDSIAFNYKLNLLVLFGIYDRDTTNVFGKLPTEGDEKVDFLLVNNQETNFTFVNEENLIGEERESFNKYIERQNAEIKSGSTVYLHSNYFDEHTCPSLYSYNNYSGYESIARLDMDSIADPDFKHGVVTKIFREKDLYCAKVPAVRTTWNADGNTFTAKVKLMNEGYLCLDGIRREDLEWYFNSRKHRKNYQSYFALLGALVRYIEKRDEEEKPTVSRVRDIIAERREAVNEEALHKALTLWRTTTQAGSVEERALDVLKRYHTFLQDDSELIKQVDALCKEKIYQPLMITKTSNIAYSLWYTTGTALATGLNIPCVFKTKITKNKKGPALGKTSTKKLLTEQTAKEATVHRWDSFERFYSLHEKSELLSCRTIQQVEDRINQNKIVDTGSELDYLDHIENFRKFKHLMKKDRYVHLPHIVEAVGWATIQDVPYVMFVRYDYVPYIRSLIDKLEPRDKQTAIGMMKDLFRKSYYAKEALTSDQFKGTPEPVNTIGFCKVKDLPKQVIGNEYSHFEFENFKWKKKDVSLKDYRITEYFHRNTACYEGKNLAFNDFRKRIKLSKLVPKPDGDS